MGQIFRSITCNHEFNCLSIMSFPDVLKFGNAKTSSSHVSIFESEERKALAGN